MINRFFLRAKAISLTDSGLPEKKTEDDMNKQLSLAELAAYGYVPSRVNRGSWLERTFGKKEAEVEDNGCIGRPDKDKDVEAGR